MTPAAERILAGAAGTIRRRAAPLSMAALATVSGLLPARCAAEEAASLARDEAGEPASVLVVANASSATSVRLARAYASARSIPASNVVALSMPESEEIERADFERAILRPIEDHLWKNRKVERIVYIVLVKGVPLKIAGSDGPSGNRASVDSELAMLYRQITAGAYPLNGRMPNPYFRADPALAGGRRLPSLRGASQASGARRGGSASAAGPADVRPWALYFVTRLDGYTEDDVRALIGRASAALGSRGRFVFDLRTSGQGDDWMRAAAETLRSRGADLVLDETAAAVTGQENVIGYCSWGSNDARYPGRGPRHGWALGSIATGFVSSDARTFQEPPPAWRPGPWRNTAAFFEGTPQSLLADLLREGATAGVGNAYEPYLDACARPEVLFPAYLAGYNLAEACYMSLPYLSWQTVIVGDPLCRITSP